MYKYLIGPVLSGAAYAAGAYYGADAEQLVRKNPSATYQGVEQMLGNVPAIPSSHPRRWYRHSNPSSAHPSSAD